jgi:hypothetical protein
MSGQKGLDQFPGERRPDHFSTQTKDIHVVIFDALVGGENIMNKPSTHTMDFVRSDGCTHAAAAKRDSALNLPGGYSPSQRDDEVGVVISGVQLMSAEVHDFVPRAAQQLRHLRFQDKATMV